MPPLELPVVSQYMDPKKLTEDQIQDQFAYFKRLMRQDPTDYKLAIGSSAQPTTKRAGNTEMSKNTKRRRKAPATRDDDDDDDDDDYE